MIGFGVVGRGTLPVLLRHLTLTPERVTVVAADASGREVAAALKVRLVVEALTQHNYEAVLSPLLGAGDFLLNVSVCVSSIALVRLARRVGALYLDTCIEPWPGGYENHMLSMQARSNYGQREEALALRRELGAGSPTALVANGANPGWISYVLKRALLNLARDVDEKSPPETPKTRREWAELARRLGVRCIHVAEFDWQTPSRARKRGEFVNTWSVDGFISEAIFQPAELGWGTHEKALPADAALHDGGCGSAIMLMQQGASTRVRSWTPLAGPFHGFLVTHNEAISIADFLTVRDEAAGGAGGAPLYRPTVHYSYRPCDAAVLSLEETVGRESKLPASRRTVVEEVEPGGVDELGVLLLGHAKTAYWFGSRLSVDEARALAPYNNATSLQVAAGVLAGMVFVLENPRLGVIEADDVDHERALQVAAPYLGELVGVYSDWTPLRDRFPNFPQRIDASDPWQFVNVRVD
jgi:homospermidine synthase